MTNVLRGVEDTESETSQKVTGRQKTSNWANCVPGAVWTRMYVWERQTCLPFKKSETSCNWGILSGPKPQFCCRRGKM